MHEARAAETARAWRALAADAPPFLAPEFFRVARPLVRSGEPLVATAARDGAMLGALPLVLAGTQLRGFLTDHSPELDYVGDREGLDAIWAMLRRDHRWSRLVLRNVPAGSLLAKRLPELARADGCPAIVRAGTRHPAFALAGFWPRISPKFRTNLERCARKCGAELERIASPTRADLDEAFSIEARGWKGAAGTGIASDPSVAHLYRAALRLFGRRGQASLSFLRAGGQRIAMMIAVEDATTLYALKIGHDPAWSSLSPGHLMVWKIAEDAERRGLASFDFVGHADEWKRKWTADGREHVTLIVYRRSARGLSEYVVREQAAPIARRWARDWRSPLPRGCQRGDLVGVHTAAQRVRGRIARGLGLRRLLRPAPPPPERLGAPSRFTVGTWVRVRDPDAIRATLDGHGKLRGLAVVPGQWPTCGESFRVERVMRRLRDDHGKMRAVNGTVLLEGVTCGATGCGRHCPLMYRDEWLEPAPRPGTIEKAPARRHARVRALDEITSGLDLRGRRDGITFMPEMAELAGKRLAIVGTIDRVFELDRWTPTPHPIYLLDGARCSGAVLGDRGPCDRACAMLWHEDWLILEPT